jgi:hypothetical protein
MKGPGVTTIAMALAFMTCATPEAAADLWKVTGLSATPKEAPDGSKVTVKCSYTMTLNEKDQDDLQVIISDNGAVKNFVNVSSAGPGSSHTTSYNIQGGGTHSVKCALKSINLATLKGKVTDEKTVTVTVTTKTVTPGGEWAPKGTPRVYIKDQKSGNVQVNPNPIPPPKP